MAFVKIWITGSSHVLVFSKIFFFFYASLYWMCMFQVRMKMI